MNELFQLILEAAKDRLKKEKETNITGETLQLISLAAQMYPWVKDLESN